MIARVPPPHRRRSPLFEIHVAAQLVNERAVTTALRSSRRVDVNGLVPLGRRVLFADNRTGVLYRVPA
jgi:hypothetical protein